MTDARATGPPINEHPCAMFPRNRADKQAGSRTSPTVSSSKSTSNSSPPTTKKHKNCNKPNTNSHTTSHKTKNLSNRSISWMKSMISSMPHCSVKTHNSRMPIASCRRNSRKEPGVGRIRKPSTGWKMDSSRPSTSTSNTSEKPHSPNSNEPCLEPD